MLRGKPHVIIKHQKCTNLDSEVTFIIIKTILRYSIQRRQKVIYITV